MMGRTHLVIGLGVGASMLPGLLETGQFSAPMYIATIAGLAVGSLGPDIDHPQSLISQYIPLMGRLVSSVTRHRGFFHSMIAVVVWFLVIYQLRIFTRDTIPAFNDAIFANFGSGFLVGYVLHILADITTNSGVKLFYPLSANVRIPIFSTGGEREKVLHILVTFVIYYQFYRVFMIWTGN